MGLQVKVLFNFYFYLIEGALSQTQRCYSCSGRNPLRTSHLHIFLRNTNTYLGLFIPIFIHRVWFPIISLGLDLCLLKTLGVHNRRKNILLLKITWKKIMTWKREKFLKIGFMTLDDCKTICKVERVEDGKNKSRNTMSFVRRIKNYCCLLHWDD